MRFTLNAILSSGAVVIALALVPHVQHPSQNQTVPTDSIHFGPLIGGWTTMVTAWDLPRNPLADSTLTNDNHLAEQIRYGFGLFTNTYEKAPQFSGNTLTCSNCHLNAGQREKALPLVGVTGAFPEYNKRAGRLISLEDRIIGCFERSMNVTGKKKKTISLTAQSKEVLALSSYITWLSSGYSVGQKIPWRGENTIHQDSLLPINKLDPKRGKRLFMEKCTNCHGKDGQGVEIGDKKAGPLWGPKSWNDGAGAARVYTLAGMIRHMMPYLDPGSLTDEDAQHIAAFICSKPRPAFPYKHNDYRTEKLPVDAVYYKR